MSTWRDYAQGSSIDDFSWFCSEYCVQSIDVYAGLPLILEPFQLDFMSEVLAVDHANYPYWKTCGLVLPRKNAKTTLFAAYTAYHLDSDDGQPDVLLCASSDKQAGRLFDSVSSFIRQSDYLDNRFIIRHAIGEVSRKDSGAIARRMSSDEKRLHGHNPSRVIADEIAQWTSPTLERAWAALTTGLLARSNAQVVAISTAGEASDRETSILGNLIDGNEEVGQVEKRGTALTISRNHHSKTLVYNYSAPVQGNTPKEKRHDFAAIRSANPASWISDDVLKNAQADPSLSDAKFLQLHGCVWADDVGEIYISPEDWKALGDGQVIEESRHACIGVDASFSYDTTVIATASRADDGKIDVDAKIFSVRPDAPHHILHHQKTIDYQDVEDTVVEYFDYLEIDGIGYDPRFFGRSVQLLDTRLDEASIIVIEPTSRHMRDALAALHRNVMDGTLRHRGDSAIAAHVSACVAIPDDRGFKIHKRDHRRPIDAVPAMAMAVYLVELMGETGAPGVFSYSDEELKTAMKEREKMMNEMRQKVANG